MSGLNRQKRGARSLSRREADGKYSKEGEKERGEGEEGDKREGRKREKERRIRESEMLKSSECDLKRLDNKYLELRQLLLSSTLKKEASQEMLERLKMVFRVNLRREELYYQRLLQLERRNR